MAAADAVSLVFDTKPRVAGETVQGEVHLNFRLLELNEFEEVNVKLRGVVSTYVGCSLSASFRQSNID